MPTDRERKTLPEALPSSDGEVTFEKLFRLEEIQVIQDS